MKRQEELEKGGYLFVHFTGETNVINGEQIYFAISKDGLHWTDLNEGNPILISEIGDKGVRDPFLVRDPKNNKFYLIATDLRIANGQGWLNATTIGSRDIIIWESDNLTEWDGPRPVTIGVEDAGCVWAPECIYDEEQEDFFVFWASNTKDGCDDQSRKQKIYCSRTKDFKIFTKPELYIERENHIIDTTMIEHEGIYYRFSKDETTKQIRMEKGQTPDGQTFAPIEAPILAELEGVEGPQIFKFNDREEWCLIVDQYATHGGYLPLITNNLEQGIFKIISKDEYDLGITKKRHGSVINITSEEYHNLNAKYGMR